MHKIRSLLLFASSLFLACGSSAQDSTKPVDSDADTLTGRWVVFADFFGTPIYFGLQLEQQGEKLTGNLDGDKLEGTISGTNIKFRAKDERGGTEEAKGTRR